jgi:LemA protein
MTMLMLTALIAGGVIAFVVMWWITTYNGLVHLKNMLAEAWSGIEVQLKRRYDLIPNLVAVVEQYSLHEKSIFERIALSRAASMNARTIEQKSQAESSLTHALRTLFAVAESYPNLKANENFLSLQQQLSTIETDVQLARRYYNGVVRDYNTAIAQFPASIVASRSGFEKAAFFELSQQAEREAPRVHFKN